MKQIIIMIVAVLVVAGLLIKKPQMTWKQSLLKAAYPVIMFMGKLTGQSKNILLNKNQVNPIDSFYDLQAVKNNGDTLSFSELKGKKVLLVNTASDCGYTGQYEELEQLHQQYGDRLVVIGFPANDFKNQEKKSDQDIAEFCKVNYGVTFLLMKKGQVIKGAQQQPVYVWLTDPFKNGWCNKQPDWNFSKYLIDENGILESYNSQWVSPKDIPINL
jgi:glutathione peroxidase